MKVLGVTLAVIGCLLCDTRVAAQTTQSMLPGAPADNIVNANFQLTADTNVSADVANQFTLGGGAGGLPTGQGQTSPLLNDLFGNTAPGQTNAFDQLVNSLFTNTGPAGGIPGASSVVDLTPTNTMTATQPPVVPTNMANTGATGTQTMPATGTSNGTDMLIPGLSAAQFGNMLTGGGSGGFPVNDTGFPTVPATGAGTGTGSGIGTLLDNTIAGTGMMNNPTGGGGIPPLPPSGSGLPSPGLGGGPSDLGNLLGSLGGAGGSPSSMFGQSGSPNPGIPTLPTNPNGLTSPQQRPRPNPMMTFMLMNAMSGGEMPEGMEMIMPMMMMQQMQRNRQNSAGAGAGAGAGYNPFGNLGGFNNPASPAGGASSAMGGNSVFPSPAGGGGAAPGGGLSSLLGGGGGMPMDPMAGMTGPMDPMGGAPTGAAGPTAGSGGSDIVSLLLGGNPGPAGGSMAATSPFGAAPTGGAGTAGPSSGFDSLLNSIMSPTGGATGGMPATGGGSMGTMGTMGPLATLLG